MKRDDASSVFKKTEKLIFAKSRLFLVFLFIVLFFGLVSASQTYSLSVTEEHPFLINGNWIPASQLQVGDLMTTADGKKARITSVKDVVLDNPVSVYNLEAGAYSDFVLANGGVVVHNSNPTKNLKYWREEWIPPRKVDDVLGYTTKKQRLDYARTPESQGGLGISNVDSPVILSDGSATTKGDLIIEAHNKIKPNGEPDLVGKVRTLELKDNKGNPIFTGDEEMKLLRSGACGTKQITPQLLETKTRKFLEDVGELIKMYGEDYEGASETFAAMANSEQAGLFVDGIIGGYSGYIPRNKMIEIREIGMSAFETAMNKWDKGCDFILFAFKEVDGAVNNHIKDIGWMKTRSNPLGVRKPKLITGDRSIGGNGDEVSLMGLKADPAAKNPLEILIENERTGELTKIFAPLKDIGQWDIKKPLYIDNNVVILKNPVTGEKAVVIIKEGEPIRTIMGKDFFYDDMRGILLIKKCSDWGSASLNRLYNLETKLRYGASSNPPYSAFNSRDVVLMIKNIGDNGVVIYKPAIIFLFDRTKNVVVFEKEGKLFFVNPLVQPQGPSTFQNVIHSWKKGNIFLDKNKNVLVWFPDQASNYYKPNIVFYTDLYGARISVFLDPRVAENARSMVYIDGRNEPTLYKSACDIGYVRTRLLNPETKQVLEFVYPDRMSILNLDDSTVFYDASKNKLIYRKDSKWNVNDQGEYKPNTDGNIFQDQNGYTRTWNGNGFDKSTTQ